MRLFLPFGALLLTFISGNPAPAQTAFMISTIAGNGTSGYFGDGGQATAAQINTYGDLVVDGMGNILLADEFNNRVRKISTTGIITTIAGTGVAGFSGDGGPATDAKFNNPHSIAIDSIGNIYIGDKNNYRIRKIDNTGTVSTVVGVGAGVEGGDGGPASAAHIGYTYGLAIDFAGNMYTCDGAGTVRKITTDGIIHAFAGMLGAGGYSGDGGPATDALLNNARGIDVDHAGNVYIAEQQNSCVRKVNTAGIISTIAGTGTMGTSPDGIPATSAMLEHPEDVAVDALGNIYIADYYANRVRVITPAGMISTAAGGVGTLLGDGCAAIAATLFHPYAVALDSNGNLLINDYSDFRIRKLTPDHVPNFTVGNSHTLSVCGGTGAISVDSLLSVIDSDAGQTETWTAAMSPSHGTLSLSYSTVSTGSILTTSGITYTPTGGYYGPDTFRVAVSECIGSDTIAVYVSVNHCALTIGTAPAAGDYNIFPNPVSDQLLITCDPGAFSSLTITNTLGQVMTTQPVSGSKTSVDVHMLPPGVYCITLAGKTRNVRRFTRQ